MKFKAFISATILFTTGLGLTGPVFAQTSLEAMARTALSENSSESAEAIAVLRAQGPNGIQALINVYADELQRNPDLEAGLANNQSNKPTISQQNPPSLQRLSQVLDALCQQRDCYASRLYWYTDLEQAKTAAKATGKPILSLRLLGRLDEEFSCANSRFFRIALYPNAEISKVLRDRFILHWQSVRPAPKITIDFGDGRKLERTLTGNSIHYVLDADGKPIDALPGLYGPQAFLKKLAQSERAVKEYASKTAEDREEFLQQYHRDRLAEIEASWTADLSKLGISQPLPNSSTNSAPSAPTALEAAPLATTKAIVELPIVRAISPTLQALPAATDEETWGKIAELHLDEARLDANSQALMQSKNPKVYQVSSKAAEIENPLQRVLPKFERAIALDTVRNEYLFSTQIHEWFVQAVSTNDVNTLNERVYSQLFLTPSSDPWLGLFPADTFTGIENDGVIQ